MKLLNINAKSPIRTDRGGYYMPVPTPDDYGMTIIK